MFHHHLGTKWKTGLMLVLGLMCVAVIYGCPFSPDDDPDPCPNPPCDGGEEPPSRRSPTELLTDYFEKVYAARDSIEYAKMLHEEFSFVFLQEDADSLRDLLGSDNFWGRTLDLESTGGLFGSEDVTDITLNIAAQAPTDYIGDDCDSCKTIETTVTLRVTTVGDGTEPLIFAVDSPQTFIARKDPADPNLWVLFRQIDRPRS